MSPACFLLNSHDHWPLTANALVGSSLLWHHDCSCPQGCNWRRHFAAARSPDRPAGYAGTAAHLPSQYHPLHCCDIYSAVNDRNRRSCYFGTGCLSKQVLGKLPETGTRVLYSQNLYFSKHLFLFLGVCGNTSAASACVYFYWFFLSLWLIKSPSSSTWISGSWYWFLAACWLPFRYELYEFLFEIMKHSKKVWSYVYEMLDEFQVSNNSHSLSR